MFRVDGKGTYARQNKIKASFILFCYNIVSIGVTNGIYRPLPFL